MSSREIEIEIGEPRAQVRGTLRLPSGAAPAPAAILLAGSGPLDRDGKHGPNRPLRDLAEGLAAAGVASIRFDKRAKVYPEAMAALARPTVRNEILDDAIAAIDLARARPEIDPRRLFVVGHSLGARLAPRLARERGDLAGLVMLAAPARKLPTLMAEQIDYISSLRCMIDGETRNAIDELRADAARVEAAKVGDEGAGFFGVPLSYWSDLEAEDPVETAAGLNIPILLMQGGRDYQVTRVDYDRYAARLGARPNVTMKWFPDLNHLFMAGEGAPDPVEYSYPGEVAAEAVATIADFVIG